MTLQVRQNQTKACSVNGSVGCFASPLVGDAATAIVLGEVSSAASSPVEQEASPKLSKLEATTVYGRRIMGASLGVDSSLDRTLVIVRQEWVSGSRGCGGKHLASLS